MKYILSLLLFVFTVSTTTAQVDSSYIRPFNFKLAVRTYISRDMVLLNQTFEDGKERSWSSNRPPSLGVGLTINNTIISMGYGYDFDFMRNKENGKTRSFDFQLHNNGRKFVFDLYLQRYKGFYEEEDKGRKITVYPDLSVHKYGLYGQYIFNYKKYSYKAAFDQNEKQLKSAGSFILGGGLYFTNISSDSSFVHLDKNNLHNFQFGVSAGYAYTWVLGRCWDISASSTVGINFGSDRINDLGKRRVKVYPTIFPRLSAGYNRDSWSLGFSFLGNGVFPSMSDKSNISVYSLQMQLTFVKRFLAIPFIDK